jgi:polyhydroxybutyrate depolymerase
MMARERAAAVVLFLMTSCLFCFSATICVGQESPSGLNRLGSGNQAVTLTIDGLARTYIVHVPTGHDPSALLPVVIVFHGGGGTARAAMWETGWTDKADKEGFLAVFPEGTRPDPSKPARFIGNPQTWNDGSKRDIGAVVRNAADVEFVRRMIEDLGTRFRIDKSRIYATGFSNGASMAFRVGRELPGTIAAIAPVAGSDWLEQEKIDRPVSLLYITGTADPLNPMEGGEIRIGRKKLGQKPPVREMINKWVRLLGCQSSSHVVREEHPVKGVAHGPCKQGSEVILYTVEGMGHRWPGGKGLPPESIVGKGSDRLKATNLIWSFFVQHPIR